MTVNRFGEGENVPIFESGGECSPITFPKNPYEKRPVRRTLQMGLEQTHFTWRHVSLGDCVGGKCFLEFSVDF